MKVKIRDLISKSLQEAYAKKKLKDEWRSSDYTTESTFGFPQPSKRAIDAERKHFPRETIVGYGEVVAYASTSGEGEGSSLVAIVKMEDGTIIQTGLERLLAMD